VGEGILNDSVFVNSVDLKLKFCDVENILWNDSSC